MRVLLLDPEPVPIPRRLGEVGLSPSIMTASRTPPPTLEKLS